MKIGIHQPNFLPWMGYFYKMAQCDAFVFLDHVEYTKRSFTKRVKIHKPNDVLSDQYLTIPLQKHSDHIKINELKIYNKSNWQRKIRAKIYETYHKAPFYFQIMPLLEKYFTHPMANESFSKFTTELIKDIAALLKIEVQYQNSSDMEMDEWAKQPNLSIVSKLNGTSYISGIGAKKYQNEEKFLQNNITLIYTDFPLYFNKMNLPNHFINKSILSYLTHYDIQFLHEILNTKE